MHFSSVLNVLIIIIVTLLSHENLEHENSSSGWFTLLFFSHIVLHGEVTPRSHNAKWRPVPAGSVAFVFTNEKRRCFINVDIEQRTF